MLKKAINYLVIFCLLLISPVLAQVASETEQNASQSLVAEPQNAPEEVLQLQSPRETVRKFISAMNKVEKGQVEMLDQALQTLYLEDIPVKERGTRGIEIANQLFKVLTFFTFKVDSIPENPGSRVYTLPIGKALKIDIVLYKYQDGSWKFNYSKTLNRLGEYVASIEKNQRTTEEDSTIDPTFKSPRATMDYFINAMNLKNSTGRIDAIKALDMSRFEPAIRQDIGIERVAMLKSVMDRYKFVDLVEIPNDTHGSPYVFLHHKAGRIVIERTALPDSNIQAWKFSAQTVEDLPALYDAFKDKPMVEGIKQEVQIPFSVRLRDYINTNFPSLLGTTLFLENWQWLGMFCVVFLGLGISKILTNLLKHSISMIFKRESLKVNQDTENRFIRPISIALTTWSWWLGLAVLSLPDGARTVLLISVKLITAVAVIWAGYRLMDVIGNYMMAKALKTHNKFDDLLVPLVTRTLKTLSIAVGLVVIADIFAFDIDKILAGLGIGGLAFALAAKDTLSNIFGSLTILIDRPFQIGDWVTIGAADGTVETVGVRSTRIRTFYNSLITIPNSQLINATIDNWGARQYRRIACTIGIAYDTPPEKIDAFCEAIRELIRKHPYTRKDYFHVYLNEFSSSNLGIMLYCFVKTPDWSTELREKHRLFNSIIKAAKELQVEFAFPTQTVYLRNDQIPSHNNIPANAQQAFKEGKETAGKIVFEELGDPPVKPPPVTFEC